MGSAWQQQEHYQDTTALLFLSPISHPSPFQYRRNQPGLLAGAVLLGFYPDKHLIPKVGEYFNGKIQKYWFLFYEIRDTGLNPLIAVELLRNRGNLCIGNYRDPIRLLNLPGFLSYTWNIRPDA